VAIGASATALAGCGSAGQTAAPARIVAMRAADEFPPAGGPKGRGSDTAFASRSTLVKRTG
jgi:hypothetical protein